MSKPNDCTCAPALYPACVCGASQTVPKREDIQRIQSRMSELRRRVMSLQNEMCLISAELYRLIEELDRHAEE